MSNIIHLRYGCTAQCTDAFEWKRAKYWCTTLVWLVTKVALFERIHRLHPEQMVSSISIRHRLKWMFGRRLSSEWNDEVDIDRRWNAVSSGGGVDFHYTHSTIKRAPHVSGDAAAPLGRCDIMKTAYIRVRKCKYTEKMYVNHTHTFFFARISLKLKSAGKQIHPKFKTVPISDRICISPQSFTPQHKRYFTDHGAPHKHDAWPTSMTKLRNAYMREKMCGWGGRRRGQAGAWTKQLACFGDRQYPSPSHTHTCTQSSAERLCNAVCIEVDHASCMWCTARSLYWSWCANEWEEIYSIRYWDYFILNSEWIRLPADFGLRLVCVPSIFVGNAVSRISLHVAMCTHTETISLAIWASSGRLCSEKDAQQFDVRTTDEQL